MRDWYDLSWLLAEEVIPRSADELALSMLRRFVIGLVFCGVSLPPQCCALEDPVAGGRVSLQGGEISAQLREQIWQRIARVRHSNRVQRSEGPHPQFGWPLRPASHLTDNGYHAIDAFVDHNPAFPDSLSDYACGSRSYDTKGGYNHRGSDYFSWPFAWLKLDQQAIEVVAAAPGTIVDRDDGNFDRRCDCSVDEPNFVILEHSDGSTAWYFHLADGSVTPKMVGETVEVGETLGIVASSGCSGAPHLHLEVYDHLDQLVDPYDGTCNSLNPGDSWWAEQRPYFDSALNSLSTHAAVPEFLPCPQTERPHYRDVFDPGEMAYFGVFYRDSLEGHQTELTIRRPDESIFSTWTYTDEGPYSAASWWIWSHQIPESAPRGTWKWQATYLGTTLEHHFRIGVELFADGFESGTTDAWSTVAP